ncbi:hypothetical protein GALL_370970 [mine drainage metagenome]|uniref:Uncharacterized protein n=1 Tax=mine drainage metagenome TaxID=410659 RepID=A0A1J5QME8_9ZZZZ
MREQTQRRRLALHDHLGTQPCQHGRITAELQRVAKALLGIDENAPACRVFAIPSGLLEIGIELRQVTPLQTPFVFPPSLRKIARQQPCQSEIGMGIRGTGIDLDRLLETGKRFINAPDIEHHIAQADEILGLAVGKRQGLANAVLSLMEVAGIAQHQAQIVPAVGIPGPGLDCPKPGSDGVRQPALTTQDHHQIRQRVKMSRLDGEGRSIRGFGFGIAQQGLTGHPEVVMGESKSGVNFSGAPEAGERLLQFPIGKQGSPQIIVRDLVRAIELNLPAEAACRAGKIAHFHQCHGQAGEELRL